MANRQKKKILVLGPSRPEFIGGVATFTRGHYRNQYLLNEFEIDTLDSVSERSPDSGQVRRLINSAWLAVRLTARLLGRRIALVHVHCSAGRSFYQKALLALLARCLGAATVLHLHVGYFSDTYESSSFKSIIRLGLRLAGRVAVVSGSLASFLKTSCRIDAVIVPNCADSGFFEIESDPASAEDVVFIGKLAESKGILVLLDALGAIREQGYANRVVLAGITHEVLSRESIESMVAAGRLEPVDVLENVSETDIRAILARAAVFVLPSLSEGMPISLLEAMAAGIPSVATTVGGIGEAVTDGEQGLLIEPGDAGQLAAALARLLSAPELRSRMGAAARKTAREKFHPDETGKTLAELYRGLLAD